MYCGSDHETQITSIPNRGQEQLEHFSIRVPEEELNRLAGLVHNRAIYIPDAGYIQTTAQIDEHIRLLTSAITDAIETIGKPDRKIGRSAPWWTNECQRLHTEHIANRSASNEATKATRNFLRTVCKAKGDCWTERIDGIKEDKELYKIVGWHKPGSNLKAPPLRISDRVVESTPETAELLRTEVLDCFSAEGDSPQDPLHGWHGCGALPWDLTLSKEEVERNVVGVSGISPGTDRITVRILKACWRHVASIIRGIYLKCLKLSYFPSEWKLAEVVMLPKVGKKDRSSPRSWWPIALLSCIAKGFERTIARRLAGSL